MVASRVRGGLVAVVAVLLMVGATTGSVVSATEGPVVSLGDAAGLERDSVTGSVFVPVFLSEPAVAPVTVAFFTAEGSATSGVDYSRWGTPTSPRTVTIPAGSLQTTINVPVLADSLIESDESFSVVIASVSGGDATVGDGTGTARIVDADEASVDNPVINVAAGTVVEGDVGKRRAQFHVQLSRPPVSNVTISYVTADFTAAAPADYTAKLPGTVVFAPGQISKTIDVLVNSNTTADNDRWLTLNVGVISGSPVEELGMSVDAFIVNDDTGAVPCAPGTYSEDGVEPCVPAPAGFFVDTAGALSATPCALGTYQPAAGQPSCLLAPLGSYVDVTGSASAIDCPDGTTTLVTGSVSADDCVPEPTGGAVAITAAGNGHSCALIDDGSARCWGINGSGGRLGDGTNFNSSVPVVVSGLSGADSIEAGGDHTCAVLDDGSARCWGANSDGQLGNGTTTNSNVPVVVPGLDGVVAVSAGTFFTCAVLVDGSARCWGANENGQLGNGTTVSSNVPVVVSGLTDAVGISVGFDHACALLADGTARCWGLGGSGRLGNGGTVSSSVPVVVSGLTGAVGLSVGGGHACAVLADGAARCWGTGSSGRLGNGSTASSSVPVVVSGLTGAVGLSAGGSHSCAVLGDGGLRCWGANSRGQLGDGGTTGSNVPVVVPGLTTVTSIGSGNIHTCATLSNGSARCWGDNVGGMLGNGGNGGYQPSPVAVVGIP